MNKKNIYIALTASILIHIGAVAAYVYYPAKNKKEEMGREIKLSSLSVKKEPTEPKNRGHKSSCWIDKNLKKSKNINEVKKDGAQEASNQEPIISPPQNKAEVAQKSNAASENSDAQSKNTEQKKVERKEPIEAKDEYINLNKEKVREVIAKYQKYPKIARKTGSEGICLISFKLYPDGNIDEIKVIKSSGYQILDKSSVQTIEQSASELPRPNKVTTLTVPIEYRLN